MKKAREDAKRAKQKLKEDAKREKLKKPKTVIIKRKRVLSSC